MIRHTGGSALGDISTRSNPFSRARSIASRVRITFDSPTNSPTTRTSLAVMASLILCKASLAAGLWNLPLVLISAMAVSS